MRSTIMNVALTFATRFDRKNVRLLPSGCEKIMNE
jgi:hypothetical protein